MTQMFRTVYLGHYYISILFIIQTNYNLVCFKLKGAFFWLSDIQRVNIEEI